MGAVPLLPVQYMKGPNARFSDDCVRPSFAVVIQREHRGIHPIHHTDCRSFGDS